LLEAQDVVIEVGVEMVTPPAELEARIVEEVVVEVEVSRNLLRSLR
jgi:hypothetical protein